MSRLPLIRWEAPGPYEVAFSTRRGGVSEGPFDSLNLGLLTGDDAEKVAENRARLCAAVGADPAELSFNRQVHGVGVRAADPSRRGRPGDALWSDVPGRALLALGADCLPVVIARAQGERPALAAAHVGWRGLLAGIVERAAAPIGPGFHAVVGPGIGPCCYEVGAEVAEPFRAQLGREVLKGRRLDLRRAAEIALLRAGASAVEHVGLCTACHPDLFFSFRRDGASTGSQGVIAYVAA